MLTFFVTAVGRIDPNETDSKKIAKQNGLLEKGYKTILSQYIYFCKMLNGMTLDDFYSLNMQERDFMIIQFNKENKEQKESLSKAGK